MPTNSATEARPATGPAGIIAAAAFPEVVRQLPAPTRIVTTRETGSDDAHKED